MRFLLPLLFLVLALLALASPTPAGKGDQPFVLFLCKNGLGQWRDLTDSRCLDFDSDMNDKVWRVFIQKKCCSFYEHHGCRGKRYEGREFCGTKRISFLGDWKKRVSAAACRNA